MSSIGSILSIARSALSAQQAGIQVAAHNISNAATPGYSRQYAQVVSSPPLVKPEGVIGTGVTIQDIARVRDSQLDSWFRRESSEAEAFQTRHQLLARVESLFSEPSDIGLGASLDAFWTSWADLANTPGSQSARTVIRARGEQLASHFNSLAGNLLDTRHSVLERLDTSVRQINEQAAGIASANRAIVAAETGGKTAGDLRDTRDLLLDEMARLVPVQVIEQSDGSATVVVAGIAIVDGTQSHELRVHRGEEGWTVSSERRRGAMEIGGVLGQCMDLVNETLPYILQSLDDLARDVANAVNSVHRDGMSLVPGATEPRTDLDFFAGGDSGTISAGSIRLAAEVDAEPGNIAAGRPLPDPDGQLTPMERYQAGANDVALAITGFRHTAAGELPWEPAASGTETFAERYAGLVTTLGVEVGRARDTAAVHEALARRADTQRSSVSGVSIDEELVSLIQHQTAYSAAARIVSVVDDMMQTLLRM